MDSVGTLDQEAMRRKERLKALREGKLKTLNAESEQNGELFPKPLFRNYAPRDEELKARILPKPDLTEIRNEIKEQLDSGKPKSLIEKEIDLATLAPQKIDWDLKRECEKKLKVLDKRTQKAIVELIRDRLRADKSSDLAELVTVGSRGFKEQNNSQAEDSQSESEDEGSVSGGINSSQSVYVYEQREISDDEEY
ncbi:coiled-coil domain-containing 12 [Brachionus plicatilis]|uniref:Coiled-coil domain-containing 12 n=1 Tax=Brachionus plicatilis TaxID=10195 RepID=A0A3M7P6V1_BRAPC|nr:coiled-coil domain-containing 12 [Brachionus plicatilis]